MNLPPGPKEPWFVQHHGWFYRPLEFLDKCHARYGDIFTIQLAAGGRHRPMVLISDPAIVQELLTADAREFDSGEGSLSLQDFLGDNSLLIMDGENHRKHRRLIKPQFYGEHLKVYGERMREICHREMSKLQQGEAFSARPFMQRLSMLVIMDAVLGKDLSAESSELETRLSKFMNWLTSPVGHVSTIAPGAQIALGPFSPWGYYLKEKSAIDGILFKLIADAKLGKTERHDVLTMLLAIRDEDGKTLSDKEIRDELLTLLIAGHETVAAAMSWALFFIHDNPDVKAKLIAELDALNGNLDPQLIYRLPYLTAVCQETLRIRPSLIVAFTRMPKRHFTLAGFEFEPKTNLMPCMYLTHQRESVFPNPQKFIPARFLDKHYSAYEYYPFGGSNRRCIGAAFAQYEMKVILAEMLSNWKIARKDLSSVRAKRRGITITPSDTYCIEVFGKR